MTTPIRVRFAPSPTGLIHLGNARTALFNWLFARSNNGTFVLRIEDTDQDRSEKKFENQLMKDLQWLGLNWDEGPDIGGAFSPYRQSEKLDLYSKYAEQLIQEKKAYSCFCSEEELQEERKQLKQQGKPPGYRGKCSRLSKEERSLRINNKTPYAIRLNVACYTSRTIEFTDLVKGTISFSTQTIYDFILIRSDKIASYNFAVVIDDSRMKITHVIRGDDHLPNTPKQIMVYKALQFDVPKFAHLPMIVGKDKRPLSKRSEGISLAHFKEKGFLKETIQNGIALLGWSSNDHKEILSMDEIIERFSLDRISKSPAGFDLEKLIWLNKKHLKALSTEEITSLIRPYLEKRAVKINSLAAEQVLAIITLIKENIDLLSHSEEILSLLFDDILTFSDEALTVLSCPESIQVITLLKDLLESMDTQTADYKQIISFLKKQGLSGKKLFMPIRVAITGQTKGPEMSHLFEIIDRKTLIKRVHQSLEHN